jgi:hypothetical protein
VIVVGALGVALVLVLAGCLEAPPPAAGERYRKRLTIPADRAAAPLVDFPVLVRLEGDPDLAAHGPPDGLDLLFLDADGAPLAFERDHWDAASGDLVAWVKIPALSGDADTVFDLHYGSGNRVDLSDPPAVWTNGFALVWHLEQAPGETSDSTATGADAEDVEGSVDQVDGYLGNGLEFGGFDDYVDFGSALPPEVDVGSALTVTGWARYDSLDQWSHFVSKAPTGDNRFGWGLGIDVGFDFLVRTMNGDVNARGWSQAAEPVPGVWYHWALVYDGTQVGDAARLRGFRDGQQHPLVYDGPIPSLFDARSGPLYIGCATWNPEFYCIDGAVDEVRVSTTPRDPAWIAAEYTSQVEGSTFLVVGPEEHLE